MSISSAFSSSPLQLLLLSPLQLLPFPALLGWVGDPVCQRSVRRPWEEVEPRACLTLGLCGGHVFGWDCSGGSGCGGGGGGGALLDDSLGLQLHSRELFLPRPGIQDKVLMSTNKKDDLNNVE